MKSLFEGIGTLFTDILLAPYGLVKSIRTIKLVVGKYFKLGFYHYLYWCYGLLA